MRIVLPGLIALVAVCRLAEGGEGAVQAADPAGALFRILTDFGALGAFVIYLIWQKKRDGDLKVKDNERWHALDREMVGLVRECTRVIAECTGILAELRKDVWLLTRRSKPSGDTDAEIRAAGQTRRIGRE